MTYLELVQLAIEKSGVREDAPTSLVGASGIVEDFAGWVNDAWVELQLEQENPPWWFRISMLQTLSLTTGTSTYAMPSGLQTLDWRHLHTYTATDPNQTELYYIEYEDWRRHYSRLSTQTGRPQYITIRPDLQIEVWPKPDQDYTMIYDGVYETDELSVNTDVPARLDEQYHRFLAWDAVVRYAKHHEDGSKLSDALDNRRKYHKKMLNRHVAPITVETGTL